MKKHIKQYSSIFLFLALSIPVFSLADRGVEDVKKKRTINKSYSVTADDKLEIENSFGNVIISTWDKNEITVDIEIGARASSEEKAQDIMNEIDVKETHNGNIIAYKTKVGEIHNGKNKSGNGDEERAFYIDYVVHMPSGNRLQLENSFGKLSVPDYNGQVNLTSKFGSLNTGRLSNVDAIDVEFGKATITEVSNGKIVFKFNKESTIGKVSGNVKITSEFSHNVQVNVGDNIKELSVFESYSGVRMIVTKSLSAEFDIHTSFGSFHNDSEFKIKEQREDEKDYGPHFDKDYNGKAGEGNARIKIKSSFGSVRLSHSGSSKKGKEDQDDDDEDEDKGKNKEKSTDQSI
ncbi:DUF4097 family beta strand repeat-containing protein [Flavitalea flava]